MGTRPEDLDEDQYEAPDNLWPPRKLVPGVVLAMIALVVAVATRAFTPTYGDPAAQSVEAGFPDEEGKPYNP